MWTRFLIVLLLCSAASSLLTPVQVTSGAQANPGHKGRKTVLFRRFGNEVTTAEDHFRIGPLMLQVDDETTDGRQIIGTPLRPEENNSLDSDEDFPTLESTKAFAEATQSSWKANLRNLGSGHDRIMPPMWGEPVRGGWSDGGHSSDSPHGAETSTWPSSLTAQDIMFPGPSGELPLEGVSWDPHERAWKLVKMGGREPQAALAAGAANLEMRLRQLNAGDLEAMKPINKACSFTEQFPKSYYTKYIITWPDLCIAADFNGELGGYVLGKVEVGPEGLYGHVSALTVRAEARRHGIAKRLMAQLELVCARKHGALYVDLFVRTNNVGAQKFYESMGYVTYRLIKGYYSGNCDALDMRKSLPADRFNRRMKPRG